MDNSETLKFYKLHSETVLPYFATKQSACFDIICNTLHTETYTGYSKTNGSIERQITNDSLVIMPGDRILVPTGVILDIPTGYSVRLHARSGTSLKQGLILANSEGIIDSDYVNELFVMVLNVSTQRLKIENGTRIAQGELVKSVPYNLSVTSTVPTQKTDRVGGLGSTGTGINKKDKKIA